MGEIWEYRVIFKSIEIYPGSMSKKKKEVKGERAYTRGYYPLDLS